MPIRTARFFQGVATTGAGVRLATVPAGQTWLLKELSLSNDQLVNDSGSAGVLAADGTYIRLVPISAVNTHTLQRWQGFMVLLPGDGVFASSVGGNLDCWFSGAKLAGLA